MGVQPRQFLPVQEALADMSWRKPVLKNRVAPEIEVVVVDLATEQPTWSQQTESPRRLAVESQRHPGTETDFPMVPRGATVGLSGSASQALPSTAPTPEWL